MGTVVGTVASLIVGAVVAGATIVGVVHSQTGAPDQSPASVTNPLIDYGSN